ncbi:hypothetical protein SAMN04515666_1012 [Bosea lupini]|uniref:Uncharacterized protein n=2 Tax=Bosea lupini TaxID=1036779 RepID=A0A1H7FB98_9HYPH|nr:hypothetical protein SAMN04515666_1012 [Bosea lupini]
MVDHIRAPKGDMALFWSRPNWQPFARICNSRKAIASEGGFGHLKSGGASSPGTASSRPVFADYQE